MERRETDMEGRLQVIPHSTSAFARVFLSCGLVPVFPIAHDLLFSSSLLLSVDF